jgi:hypothetical protein
VEGGGEGDGGGRTDGRGEWEVRRRQSGVGARRFWGERERGVRAEGGAAEGKMERRQMTDRGILGAGGSDTGPTTITFGFF